MSYIDYAYRINKLKVGDSYTISLIEKDAPKIGTITNAIKLARQVLENEMIELIHYKVTKLKTNSGQITAIRIKCLSY